jgi:plasmid replication initiation protein
MEAKSTDLVVKANVLVEASYRLTLTEQRIILAAIVEARESQKGLGDGELTIYARDFAALFPDVEEGSAYGQLKEAADVLFERQVTFHDTHPESGKPRVTKARWISSSSYISGIGAIQIRIAPEMVPYITRIEENLTRYRLERIANLNSVYAVRLYELLVQRVNFRERSFRLDELKRILGLGPSEYSSIKDFKKWVIDVAVTQINTHTDIRVGYENIKSGRTVTGLRFTIDPVTEQPQKPSRSLSRKSRQELTDEYLSQNNLGRPGETHNQARTRIHAQWDKEDKEEADRKRGLAII